MVADMHVYSLVLAMPMYVYMYVCMYICNTHNVRTCTNLFLPRVYGSANPHLLQLTAN